MGQPSGQQPPPNSAASTNAAQNPWALSNQVAQGAQPGAPPPGGPSGKPSATPPNSGSYGGGAPSMAPAFSPSGGGSMGKPGKPSSGGRAPDAIGAMQPGGSQNFREQLGSMMQQPNSGGNWGANWGGERSDSGAPGRMGVMSAPPTPQPSDTVFDPNYGQIRRDDPRASPSDQLWQAQGQQSQPDAQGGRPGSRGFGMMSGQAGQGGQSGNVPYQGGTVPYQGGTGEQAIYSSLNGGPMETGLDQTNRSFAFNNANELGGQQINHYAAGGGTAYMPHDPIAFGWKWQNGTWNPPAGDTSGMRWNPQVQRFEQG